MQETDFNPIRANRIGELKTSSKKSSRRCMLNDSTTSRIDEKMLGVKSYVSEALWYVFLDLGGPLRAQQQAMNEATYVLDNSNASFLTYKCLVGHFDNIHVEMNLFNNRLNHVIYVYAFQWRGKLHSLDIRVIDLERSFLVYANSSSFYSSSYTLYFAQYAPTLVLVFAFFFLFVSILKQGKPKKIYSIMLKNLNRKLTPE